MSRQAYTLRIVRYDGRSKSRVARCTMQLRYTDGPSKMIDICTRGGQLHLNLALRTLEDYLDAEAK